MAVSLIHTDSFDWYTTVAAGVASGGAYTVATPNGVAPSIQTTSVRTGRAALQLEHGNTTVTVPLDATYNAFIVTLAYLNGGTTTTGNWICSLRLAGAAQVALQQGTVAEGNTIRLVNSASTVLATGVNPISAGVWVHLQWVVSIADAGQSWLYVTGVSDHTASVDTKSQAGAGANQLWLGAGTNVVHQRRYDDLAIFGGASVTSTDRPGEVKVQTMAPSGTGFSDEWTPIGGGTDSGSGFGSDNLLRYPVGGGTVLNEDTGVANPQYATDGNTATQATYTALAGNKIRWTWSVAQAINRVRIWTNGTTNMLGVVELRFSDGTIISTTTNTYSTTAGVTSGEINFARITGITWMDVVYMSGGAGTRSLPEIAAYDVAVANWDAVDSDAVFPDVDDTDYVASSTTGQVDLYASANTTSAGTVLGVRELARLRKTDAGTRQVKQVIRTGGTTYEGATHSVTSTYVTHQNIRTINPNTGVAFTIAELNAMEQGIKLEV